MTTLTTEPTETATDTRPVVDARAIGDAYAALSAEMKRLQDTFAAVTAYYQEKILPFEPTPALVDADPNGSKRVYNDLALLLSKMVPAFPAELVEGKTVDYCLEQRVKETQQAVQSSVNMIRGYEQRKHQADLAEIERSQRAREYAEMERREGERVERLRRGELA